MQSHRISEETQAESLGDNRLLACLPDDNLRLWQDHLEPVQLRLDQVLCEAGASTQVYFPISAIVSLLYVMESGESVELAIVGNEGIVGVPSFMGGGTTPSRAVVKSAGYGYRLAAPFLKQEFNRVRPVMHLMLRYTQALITQLAQTAVCNRHHSLDQQLCRWMLMRLDRLAGNEIVMTHELIAGMLGVRREGVTQCATKLQRTGIIRYTRGRITVLDRAGLEERSCECYGVVRREYERLLPAETAT